MCQTHDNKVRLPIVAKDCHIVTNNAVNDFNAPRHVNNADIIRHFIWLQHKVLLVNVRCSERGHDPHTMIQVHKEEERNKDCTMLLRELFKEFDA